MTRGPATEMGKTERTVSEWQLRFKEASAFLREHDEQMRLLNTSLRIRTDALGVDNEAIRSFARIREQQGLVERLASPIEALTRFTKIADTLNVPYGLSAKALDSMSSLNALATQINALSGPGSAYSQALKSVTDFTDRFRLPQSIEIERLFPKIPDSIWQNYSLPKSQFEKILDEFRSPWLDVQRQLESLTNLAKLHGIGHLISTRPPFDPGAVSAFRTDFGDWRDRISFPEEVAINVPLRSAFYAERGYNSALADFPSETFEEGVVALRSGVPVLISAYGEPVPPSDSDVEEQAFTRNNVIYNWLQRFETQIRFFIDKLMTDQFGNDWPRHQLPAGVYDKWVEKQAKDRSGRSWPIVYYADFTDYERVICRQDNWKAVFAKYFYREESVRESLQRLHMPRLATMHARPLTQDDELFVFVEVRRLVRLFGL